MVRPKDGTLFGKCRPCKNRAQREQRMVDPERHKRDSRESHYVARRRFFEMYGWKCRCCGTTFETVLQMDHVQNDGNEHRKTTGTTQCYRDACREHRPDRFQTLCRNCNWAKGRSSENPKRCACKDPR